MRIRNRALVWFALCLASSCSKPAATPKPTPPSQPSGDAEKRSDSKATESGGLTTAERGDFYHLPEGSALFPLDWLRALRDKDSGRPFLESPERFGLLPDENHPLKLPVGLAPEVPRGMSSLGQWVGINCAACHVGELTYKGKSFRIDGGPNLFNLDHFYRQLFDSLGATVEDPDKMLAFLTDLLNLKGSYLDQPGNESRKESLGHVVTAWTGIKKLAGDELGEHEKAFVARIKSFLGEIENEAKSDQEVHELIGVAKDEAKSLTTLKAKLKAPFENGLSDLKQSLKSVEARVGSPLEKFAGLGDSALDEMLGQFVTDIGLFKARLRFLKTLKEVNENQPAEPGHGRIDAFMNARNLVYVPMNPDYYAEPTSPVSYPYIWGIEWFGWFHYDGNTNSFIERNTGQALGLGAIFNNKTYESTIIPANLHQLEEYARALAAPAWPFGPIDADKAKRGAALYQEHCVRCHAMEPVADSTKFFDWDEIKTDRMRLTNVAKKVGDEPYYTALDSALKAIKEQAYVDHDIPPATQRAWEHNTVEIFRQTDKFIARPLVSVWASPPFLHNGSVPRLYDLLLPKAQRPPVFYLSPRAREYDPEKLGYVLDTTGGGPSMFFKFDTSKVGNDNGGHEYGTSLSDEDRMALLEYMKKI